jgi:hypothetical protein
VPRRAGQPAAERDGTWWLADTGEPVGYPTRAVPPKACKLKQHNSGLRRDNRTLAEALKVAEAVIQRLTRPRSCTGVNPLRASTRDKPAVNPLRSATIGSPTAPAIATTPCPSAVTRRSNNQG